MTPTGLMLVTGILWVLLFICLIANFARAGKQAMDFDTDGFGNTFALHAIFGGLLTLDSLAFLGGLVWFLVVKFS